MHKKDLDKILGATTDQYNAIFTDKGSSRWIEYALLTETLMTLAENMTSDKDNDESIKQYYKIRNKIQRDFIKISNIYQYKQSLKTNDICAKIANNTLKNRYKNLSEQCDEFMKPKDSAAQESQDAKYDGLWKEINTLKPIRDMYRQINPILSLLETAIQNECSGDAEKILKPMVVTIKENIDKYYKSNNDISFLETCESTIEATMPKLEKHRGVWHGKIPGAIRALLGVLAAPVFLLGMGSKDVRTIYSDTFFKKPTTTSAVCVSKFKERLSAILPLPQEQQEKKYNQSEGKSLQ